MTIRNSYHSGSTRCDQGRTIGDGPGRRYPPGVIGDGTTHALAPPQRERVLTRLADALATASGVEAAWAFGSFVAGDTPFRDLDLGVLFTHPMSWRSAPRLARQLAESLHLPFPLDVVPLNDARPGFQADVTWHGRLLFERQPGAGDHFAVSAASRRADLHAWLAAHGVRP